jgi:hypothetical protein
VKGDGTTGEKSWQAHIVKNFTSVAKRGGEDGSRIGLRCNNSPAMRLEEDSVGATGNAVSQWPEHLRVRPELAVEEFLAFDRSESPFGQHRSM